MQKKITKFLAAAAAIVMAFQPFANSLTALAEGNDVEERNTTLITYDVPDPSSIDQSSLDGKVRYEWSDYYSVKVRPEGAGDDEWKDLAVFKARVQNLATQDAAFVTFDCDGPVEVQVISKKISPLDEKTAINPASANITPKYDENSNVMTFIANPKQRLVVDPNGDVRHSLHVYANEIIHIPTEEELRGRTVTYIDASKGESISYSYDTDIVIVKSGFYNNSFAVKSNQTWYLDGGAIIRGSATLDNTKNAKLIGHGVFYRPDGRALSMDNSEDSYIEGVIVANYGAMDWGGCLASVSNSKNITVNNVKSISCNKWSDAIDIFCSEDVTIEDCFIRSGDDAIALYGPRWNGKYWGETGNIRNINVTGCVLMPDRAHPIMFAAHGDGTSPNGGRVFDNMRFKDLDFLTYNTYATDGGDGLLPLSMGFTVADGNMITNAYFDDIRIQDAAPNHIFTMNIATSGYGTGTIAGRGVNNIYFKDVKYTNPNENFSTPISGYSATQLVQNMTFENLTVNGNLVTNAQEGKISIGNYVENVKFVQSSESRYVYNATIVPEDIWPTYYDYTKCEGVSVSALGGDSNPELAIDNDESTVWYSSYGSKDPSVNASGSTDTTFNQEIAESDGLTIDLGAVRHLRCIRITWEQIDYHKYRLYASSDGVNWATKSDEQAWGAINPKADSDGKRVKWNWLANQRDNINARYVKIVPCNGSQLKISEVAVLGEVEP